MAGSGSRKGKSKVFQKDSENRSRISRQINSAVNRALVRRAEKKFFTSGAGNNESAAAGTVWAITQGIIQGDTVSSRDGSQIMLQEVGLKMDVFLPTAAVAFGVRVILFADKMNLGVLPGVTDVLNTSSMVSPYSVSQVMTNRFTILGDTVRNFTAGGIQQTLINMQRTVRHKVTYNGTSDAAASNGKGALFFLILTDSGTTTPSYDFAFHVRYLDM